MKITEWIKKIDFSKVSLCCFSVFFSPSGSGLRCYKCSDYTGRCQNVQECTFEDSCISLSERGQLWRSGWHESFSQMGLSTSQPVNTCICFIWSSVAQKNLKVVFPVFKRACGCFSSGGKTIRQCIRYTDCDNSRLSQMFPAIAGFTYRCCSSNLCNSGSAVTSAAPAVALVGTLLSVWWCWT